MRETSLIRFGSQTAHGFDERHAKLAAQARNKYLNSVRVAIEILRVNVLSKLRLRDEAAAMVHQVREDAELVAGELHRRAVQRDTRLPRIQRHAARAKLRREVAACPSYERTQAREHLQCDGKNELEAVIPEGGRRQKGSIMASPALFAISVTFGLVVWGAVAWHYLWPSLRDRPSPENLKPILLLSLRIP